MGWGTWESGGTSGHRGVGEQEAAAEIWGGGLVTRPVGRCPAGRTKVGLGENSRRICGVKGPHEVVLG